MSSDKKDLDRRDFIKTTTAAGFGVALGANSNRPGPLFLFGGSPNEKVRVGVIGVNGRGIVHAQNFSKLPNSEVAYICDVDSKVIARAVTAAGRNQTAAVKTEGDFRKVLDDKTVDAISIAAPDHWHAPMTLMAMKAGKHVYVEKPSGHNPREDELLVEAAAKSKMKVQLGAQRRSGPRFFEAIQLIKDGAIGNPYQARAWYANTRDTIGKGKVVPVPANLDFDLWQGPAPRTEYRDNIIHYNWHWFTRWGTGEICNNGTHEIDVARWFLGVDFPTTVYSSGARYHFADDWEFPDTQEAIWEFQNGKSIIWQGQSCNGLPTQGRSRGTSILGTAGSMVIDQDGWVITDLKNKVIKVSVAEQKGDALNTTGDDALTSLHMANWLDAIRTGAKLNLSIEDGAKTGMLCHLGTISQQTGRKLHTNPKTGHIIGDDDAAKRWSRSYAPGWTPTA
jgi:predicted dehydrogenase